jgi:hypothetical protein
MGTLNLGIVNLGLGLYQNVLGHQPGNVLTLSGVCMILAAAAVLTVREGRASAQTEAAIAA